MDKPGFTPGPWYAYSPLASGVHAGHHYKVANSKPCGIVEDEDGSLVPDFPDWCAESRIICTTTDDELSRANARLIAAAPLLYEACRSALERIDGMNEAMGVIDELRRAIASAEGRAV